MLTITVPETCSTEREWILRTILGDFLGLEFQCRIADMPDVLIQANGCTLEISDCFFRSSAKQWLEESTLPKIPLDNWDTTHSNLDAVLTDHSVPVLFGLGEVTITSDYITLGLDIFGSAFYMLSRYEEIVLETKDAHGRFPAKSSIAGSGGFLYRPIVNEYVEILWECMHRLWPQLTRKKHEFKSWITADVDHPYSAGIRSATRQIRQIGADIIVRRSLARALGNLRNYFASKRGNYDFDPYYPLIRWMMEVNERAGNVLTFFMMAGATNRQRDNGYSLDEPIIRGVIREISERGHAFGLHPSYETYNDSSQIRRELENLRNALNAEGIASDSLGGRQHYLRWTAPTTARNYQEAGLKYDASLGYAEQPGFRCGTCYEYDFYDAQNRCRVQLKVRPLVVMEGTLFSRRYMNMDVTSGTELALRLKENCQLFNGTFSLLWHNSSFLDPWAGDVYRELID